MLLPTRIPICCCFLRLAVENQFSHSFGRMSLSPISSEGRGEEAVMMSHSGVAQHGGCHSPAHGAGTVEGTAGFGAGAG